MQLMTGLSVNETFKDSKSVWVAVILLLLNVEVQQDRGKVGQVEGSMIL